MKSGIWSKLKKNSKEVHWRRKPLVLIGKQITAVFFGRPPPHCSWLSAMKFESSLFFVSGSIDDNALSLSLCSSLRYNWVDLDDGSKEAFRGGFGNCDCGVSGLSYNILIFFHVSSMKAKETRWVNPFMFWLHAFKKGTGLGKCNGTKRSLVSGSHQRHDKRRGRRWREMLRRIGTHEWHLSKRGWNLRLERHCLVSARFKMHKVPKHLLCWIKIFWSYIFLQLRILILVFALKLIKIAQMRLAHEFVLLKIKICPVVPVQQKPGERRITFGLHQRNNHLIKTKIRHLFVLLTIVMTPENQIYNCIISHTSDLQCLARLTTSVALHKNLRLKSKMFLKHFTCGVVLVISCVGFAHACVCLPTSRQDRFCSEDTFGTFGLSLSRSFSLSLSLALCVCMCVCACGGTGRACSDEVNSCSYSVKFSLLSDSSNPRNNCRCHCEAWCSCGTRLSRPWHCVQDNGRRRIQGNASNHLFLLSI